MIYFQRWREAKQPGTWRHWILLPGLIIGRLGADINPQVNEKGWFSVPKPDISKRSLSRIGGSLPAVRSKQSSFVYRSLFSSLFLSLAVSSIDLLCFRLSVPMSYDLFLLFQHSTLPSFPCLSIVHRPSRRRSSKSRCAWRSSLGPFVVPIVRRSLSKFDHSCSNVADFFGGISSTCIFWHPSDKA